MPKLTNPEKAAKALEKTIKGIAIVKESTAPLSREARKAGLDQMKAPRIFAEVRLPSAKNKNVELTREDFLKELNKTMGVHLIQSNAKDKTKATAMLNSKALIDSLHPDLYEKASRNSYDNDTNQLVTRAIRLIENNPNISASDAGKIMLHHYDKQNIIGHFSNSYLKTIVNTPKEERQNVHNFIKDLTSTKKVTRELQGRGGPVQDEITVPVIRPENIRKVFNLPYNFSIKAKQGGRGRFDWRRNTRINEGGYTSGPGLAKVINIAKRKASIFTDAESKSLFYTMLSDELKNPSGNSLDDIVATVKALMM